MKNSINKKDTGLNRRNFFKTGLTVAGGYFARQRAGCYAQNPAESVMSEENKIK